MVDERYVCCHPHKSQWIGSYKETQNQARFSLIQAF